MKELLGARQAHDRTDVLHTAQELNSRKGALLALLRKQGIHVLFKGTLENYYPNGVMGVPTNLPAPFTR